ncbi:M56 family metallopeptidase [Dyadobacter sp. MSC1_007]|jgi:hypothetical protein|uniref:M56 family metallopeptidase n=1 Tax=Dyadobacter sp. MSC1_007 TaxID=2909264 RepID=UPI00202E35BF|nr:M56 family metallopeptidase [Dyadobacter sp. MSC1_007]
MNVTYVLEVNLCLTLFIVLYQAAFQRLTFFTFNRFYLLGGLIISLLLPAVFVPSLGQVWIEPVKEVMQVSRNPFITHSNNYTTTPGPWIAWTEVVAIVVASVAVFRLMRLVLDILAVIRLIRKYPHQKAGPYRIIDVWNEVPTSSFFKYIFIDTTQCSSTELRLCVAHEQVHGRQYHTADWLLVRFLRAIFWFNPFMRMWEKAITANHEFIADAKTAEVSDTYAYSQLLVQLASSVRIPTLHYFSYGQIKTRIIMLHQTPSAAVKRLRFLAVVPLIAFMLTIISCEKYANPEASGSEYLYKELVGRWENMNRTTINDNDGKTPRDFPERSGMVRACLSNLQLDADGRFQMHDSKSGEHVSGTWQSNRLGNEVLLRFKDEKAGPTAISLQIADFDKQNMGAWQRYAADEKLSSGSVYYEYKKL